MSKYIITSFYHASYSSEYNYLHIFRVNFLLKRHLSRDHRISCPAHYLERTDNKPFSRLIGPTHKQVEQLPIKTGWRDALLTFCSSAKVFKLITICDSNNIQIYNHLVRKRPLNPFAKLAK